MSRKRRPRPVTGTEVLGCLTVGALLGIGLRWSNPDQFSWWLVVACAVAVLFLYGGHLRANRWEERSAAAFIAASLVAWAYTENDLLFLLITVGFVGAALWLRRLERNRPPHW